MLLAESERPEADALATVYAYEPGTFRPLAVVKRDDAAAGAAVYHYHVDHLGTPQELTDGLGTVVWQAEYRAWGAVSRARVADVAQPLRFPGQYADGETGLYYNRFRYYSPAEGRFITQDPIRLAGGSNVAAYAPNPIVWADPFGLAKHITYIGTKTTPSGDKPYSGYAHGPDKLTADQVLRRRYSSNFSNFSEPPTVIYAGDSKPIARGLEQRAFEQMGGLDATANLENPVGPRNKNRAAYLKAADEHLANSPETQRRINALNPSEPEVPPTAGGCAF